MFTKKIEIVDIGSPTLVNTGKKPYNVIEVAFKEDGKIGGKKLLSFQNEQIFLDIQKYKRGDFLAVQTEKDDKGFWQWVSISVENGGAAAGSKATEAKTGRVVGSTYETAEERKIKQRYIVRQSSITAALSFAELIKMSKPSVQSIIGMAQEFEAYVFSDVSEKKEEAVDAINSMLDDVPY